MNPETEDALPRKGNAATRLIGRSVLAVMGWKFSGTLPNSSKLVIVAAPHTSNWDFIIGMAAICALGVSVHWLGKHTIFVWPVRSLFRWLGGIPVDRTAAHGTVEQSVRYFQTNDKMILGLSPEGTRKRVEHWKTGFYHIAMGAGVPVCLVALDYATSQIKIGPSMQLTGDLNADLKRIKTFYLDVKGKYADQFTAE